VSAAGAASLGFVAARLSVLGVAGNGKVAAAGLTVFASAAVFAVLRAHLAILALAAVHGSLVVLAVVFAAGHLFAVFSLAAVGCAIFVMATRLGGVALMSLVITTRASRCFRVGRQSSLRASGLLRDRRQPGTQRQHQYNSNHSQFHFFTFQLSSVRTWETRPTR
jgi:hypothetical protein